MGVLATNQHQVFVHGRVLISPSNLYTSTNCLCRHRIDPHPTPSSFNSTFCLNDSSVVYHPVMNEYIVPSHSMARPKHSVYFTVGGAVSSNLLVVAAVFLVINATGVAFDEQQKLVA